MRRRAALALALAAAALLALAALIAVNPDSAGRSGCPRGVLILDTLSSTDPNPDMLARVAADLRSAGCRVTTLLGRNATVENILRYFPDADVILARVHSLRAHLQSGEVGTILVTAEPYSRYAHSYLQASGGAVEVRLNPSGAGVEGSYFGLTSSILAPRLRASGAASVGCETGDGDDLASAVLSSGWWFVGVRGDVSVGYADALFESVAEGLVRGEDLCSAVDRFASLVGPDPNFGGVPSCLERP